MTTVRDPGASLRRWAIIPLVVVELLLVVAVVGGVTALRDRHTLQSRHSLSAVATVTRTSKSCRGGCAWDSYGRYVVAQHREDDVLLQCCAHHPLSGQVRVAVAPGRLRHPVLVGGHRTGPLVLGAAALVVLVVGNVGLLLVVRARRAV